MVTEYSHCLQEAVQFQRLTLGVEIRFSLLLVKLREANRRSLKGIDVRPYI